jgi:hypothetical protein
MLQTLDELCESEELCKYCSATEFGEHKFGTTPNGYYSCEGSFCEEAYDSYLDDKNMTENIVKYACNVTLINKEELDEYTVKV